MVYFINGGNSGAGTSYVGVAVGNATNSLTTLRTEILGSGEGWVIGDVDDIGGSGQFSVDGTGTANNKIRILFASGTNTLGGRADQVITIRVRDLDANGQTTGAILTNYSPNNFHQLQISSAGGNILYGAIYEDCMNLMTIPSSGFSVGIHVGMVDRVDPTDRTAMYIGYTNYFGGTTSYTSDFTGWYGCYSAIHPGTNVQWYRVSEPYADNGLTDINEDASTGSIQLQGLDIVSIPTFWGFGSALISPSSDNPNFEAYIGRANSYQGKPILLPYLIIEGRDHDNNTGWTTDRKTYCKGVVRDLVTGMAYMAAGAQWETNNSETYISTGGSGWLAFRIA